MFLRNLSKLFLYSNKPTLKPHVSPIFIHRTLFLSQTRSSSPAVSSNVLPEKQGVKLYFMQYLLNNPIKYSIVDTGKISLDYETNFKSLNLLKNFLNSDESEISTELVDCLRNELKTYGLEEIYKFIILLSQHNRDPRIKTPLKELDYELVSRKFSNEELLKILCLCREKFPWILINPILTFPSKSFSRLCQRIHKLSSEQVVQLLFCMKKLRPEILRKVKFTVQEGLSSKISQFNAEELGIIAESLVDNEIRFSHAELPHDILFRTIEELDNISDIAISKLCKLFETNLQMRHVNGLLSFQEKLIPYLSKFNMQSLSLIATTGFNTNCMNPSLWAALADHFKRNIANYELADINRFVHATTVYNIQDEELLHLAIKQFETRVDVVRDHKILISFLYNLILHNCYVENLLRLVFSENFAHQFNPELFSIQLKKRYCFINSCIELEKPTLNVKLIDPEKWTTLLNVFRIVTYSSVILKNCNISLFKIGKILEDIFGKNSTYEANCLPHYNHGIVMRFDKNLKAKTSDESKFKKYYKVQKASNDDHLSLFIMVIPAQHYLYNSDTPILVVQTQIRQLKALGYKPILLNQNVWMKIVKENNEREFLRNLIIKNLGEISEES